MGPHNRSITAGTALDGLVRLVAGVNRTDELIWELQDEVQSGNQMLAWLVRKAGGDPVEIGRVPSRHSPTPPEGFRAVV